MYIPCFGQGMDDLEFIYLERDFEKDRLTLMHRIEDWKQNNYELWITFFPEGTDFSKEKLEKGIKVPLIL